MKQIPRMSDIPAGSAKVTQVCERTGEGYSVYIGCGGKELPPPEGYIPPVYDPDAEDPVTDDSANWARVLYTNDGIVVEEAYVPSPLDSAFPKSE